MAKGNDLVKYVTEQIVHYVEQPIEQRREAKKIARASREPWLVRWFGTGGLSIILWNKKRQDRRQNKAQR